MQEDVEVPIPSELEAEIRRLFHVEHWKVNTIADQLGIHHTTVARVLDQGTAAMPRRRRSLADPYVAFMVATLEKYPRLTAARLFEMVRMRGYPGRSDGHFRRIVARHRPRRVAEAYHRLRTLPGEQGQVDWAHFGHIQIGRARRPLMAFVMVLSWSRRLFVRFFLDQRMASFLTGHVAAFDTWGGLARVLLYDNLRSAVLERRGDAIRFNPALLAFADHYRYEPRPVAVARGNEKGRVERAIRYLRDRFFPARRWRDLDDLNAQVEQWCASEAAERLCPEDRSMTVAEAFAREQPHLLSLPADHFPAEETVAVNVPKTPYVRFDLNDYSVPADYVRRALELRATVERVRILDGGKLVAEHPRSYDKGALVEQREHIEALTERKRQAREHRGIDRLQQAAPRSRELLVAAAERGRSLRTTTAALLRLLDAHGAAELDIAIAEALERGVPHPHAVRHCLERRRHERQLPPALPVHLPDDPRVRNLIVRPHALDTYDRLESTPDEDHDHSDDH